MFLQVVAFMLEVRYTTINNRYQKLKRKQLRRWTIAALSLCIIFALLSAFALIQRSIAIDQKEEAHKQTIIAAKQRDEALISKAIAEASMTETEFRAARAWAASKFLADLLESREMRVVDAIHAAEAKLDAGNLKGQPVIEAGLRLAIGRSLRNFGDLDSAETNLTKAVALFRKHTGSGTGGVRLRELKAEGVNVRSIMKEEFLLGDELARSLAELALLRLDQQKYADGEAFIREALALLKPKETDYIDKDEAVFLKETKAVQDSGVPLLIESLLLSDPTTDSDILVQVRAINSKESPNTIILCRIILARLLDAQGKIAESEAAWRELIDDATKLPLEHRALEVNDELGRILVDYKRFADAEVVYSYAASLIKSDDEENQLLKGSILTRLARACAAQGKNTEAEKSYRHALLLLREVFQSGRSSYAVVVYEMEEFLRRQNKIAECESLCREDLAFCRKSSLSRDVDLSRALYNLAFSIASAGQYEEAIPFFREGIERSRDLSANDDKVVGMQTMLEAALLRVLLGHLQQGTYDLAVPLATERLQLQLQRPSAKPSEVYETFQLIAKAQEVQGKFADQEKTLRSAVAYGKNHSSDGSSVLATFLDNLGTCLRAQRRYDEAEATQREAIAIYRKTVPSGHLDLIVSMYNFAELRLLQNRLEEAELMMREVCKRARETGPGRTAVNLKSQCGLALVLIKAEKYEEAEQILRDLLKTRQTTGDVTVMAEDREAATLLKVILTHTDRLKEAASVESDFGLAPTADSEKPK